MARTLSCPKFVAQFFMSGCLGGRLSDISFGAHFGATKSPYKAVNSALNYAFMFIGVDLAFLITAAATMTLSRFYAASVVGERLFGFVAFGAFFGAYGLIYLLLKSEDYAPLIGSTTAFAAIAVTMYITQNLDWYGVATPHGAQ